MTPVLTAQDRRGQSLPVPRLAFNEGMAVDAGESLVIERDCVCLLTATAALYVRVGAGAAGPEAGSIYLAAGLPLHLQLRAGDRLVTTAAGTATGGVLLVMPLATE